MHDFDCKFVLVHAPCVSRLYEDNDFRSIIFAICIFYSTQSLQNSEYFLLIIHKERWNKITYFCVSSDETVVNCFLQTNWKMIGIFNIILQSTNGFKQSVIRVAFATKKWNTTKQYGCIPTFSFKFLSFDANRNIFKINHTLENILSNFVFFRLLYRNIY